MSGEPSVVRLDGQGRREVFAAQGKTWACYARTGGKCYRHADIPCPCDGWVPFLDSWRKLGDAIDIDPCPYPAPPERCIADLLDVCIEVAETEGQITGPEYAQLRMWFEEWRRS